MRAASRSRSTRALRAELADTLAKVAAGAEILVTRRGRPYVRIVPIAAPAVGAVDPRHPLRGSVLRMAADFDAPLAGLWSALEP